MTRKDASQGKAKPALPAWFFFRAPLNPASATEIRRKRESAKRLAELGVVRRGRVKLMPA